jgi:uncharacterized tellurite resistance protein B-like protein
MTSGGTTIMSSGTGSAAAAVRQAIDGLAQLPVDDARLLECLAFTLNRVAGADRTVSDPETVCMETLLMRLAELPPPQAILAVELARHRAQMADVAGGYRMSRELRRCFDTGRREEFLDALIQVATADGVVCVSERTVLHQIGTELGFTQHEVDERLRGFPEESGC